MRNNSDTAFDALSRDTAKLSRQIHLFTDTLEKFQVKQYFIPLVSIRYIAIYQFLMGILAGLGAVVGIALLVVILGRFETAPYIGHFVSEIIRNIQHK